MSLLSPPTDLRSTPRYATRRQPSRPTRGRYVAGVGRLLGWRFHQWQTDAADVAMEFDPATKLPCYRTVGVDVSRQNGKTTLVCSRIGTQLIIPKQTVAYTAQDRALAVMKWAEHVELLMDSPFASKVANVQRAEHKEMLVMLNGSRYIPVTPTRKKGGRSLSIDLAVIDEAQAHESMGVISAIQPAMAAKLHAQLWVLGCAGEMTSELLNHYQRVGRLEVANPASTMCWIEYSAAEDADVFDRQAWLDANPTLDQPNGVSSLALSDAALTMDSDTFRREHLNIPPTSISTTGIDKVAWAGCKSDLAPGEVVAFALDLTPEGDRGSLVVAGSVDGRTPIEVIEATSDIATLVARTAAVATAASAGRRAKDRAVVVVDRTSPAYSAVPALEKAGVAVRLIPGSEFAAACVEFHNAAKVAAIAHQDDYRLNDALSVAVKQPTGDKWRWGRRAGGDITPLAAATMARWGVLTSPDLRRSAYEDDDVEPEADESVDVDPGVFVA